MYNNDNTHSSEAQKYHGLDKRTKSVFEQMFSFHNKEKKQGYNAKIYARKSRKMSHESSLKISAV